MNPSCKASGNENGQTLVEYALILALVAILATLALTTLGGRAASTMDNAANAMTYEEEQEEQPPDQGCGSPPGVL